MQNKKAQFDIVDTGTYCVFFLQKAFSYNAGAYRRESRVGWSETQEGGGAYGEKIAFFVKSLTKIQRWG